MGFWRKKVIQPALDSETESTLEEQQELLRKDPSNPHAYFALGALAHLRGETAAAIGYFKKTIELDPVYAAPHASLGRIYAIQGNYDLAWEHARAAERSGDRSLVDQLERYSNTTQAPAKEETPDSKTPQKDKPHL